MRDPQSCQSMLHVRAEIDRLDDALVRLLAERAGYIDRAAELKPAEGLPARIEARVDEVLNRVKASARADGLDERLVDGLWRQLIEWSIAREEAVLGRG